MKSYQERQSGKILKGFGQDVETIEKAVTYIKTEKDIHDSLDSMIKKFSTAIAEIQAEKAVCIVKVGAEPDVDAYHYDYSDGAPKKKNKVEYKRYPYSYEMEKQTKDVCSEPVLTNFTTVNANVTGVKEDPRIKYMEKYNELCNREWDFKRRKKTLKTKRDNLNPSSKREHKLDGYELTSYGFGSE